MALGGVPEHFGALGPSPQCLIHEGKCTCPPLKVGGGVSIRKMDPVQSSHPKYITSREPVVDPETGNVLYDREQPILWEEAVRHGLVADVPARSERKSRNTARKPGRNTALEAGDDR